jgi:pyruvate/2-oxoglutarate dehydrogenase complex dihydrolipoamide acyltransferase (E2) component
MRHELRVPDLDGDAFVAEWFKEVGDPVADAEEVVELVTDKANIAIEAPAAGTLVERCFASEDRVEAGALLAVLEDGS